mmetsp:Transcript_25455/g.70110  ORF Transcript_25455/g.70110 Transcript_25455/m.70110 type:complete len:263 (-) Transcript_25455:1220-2008(-)
MKVVVVNVNVDLFRFATAQKELPEAVFSAFFAFRLGSPGRSSTGSPLLPSSARSQFAGALAVALFDGNAVQTVRRRRRRRRTLVVLRNGRKILGRAGRGFLADALLGFFPCLAPVDDGLGAQWIPVEILPDDVLVIILVHGAVRDEFHPPQRQSLGFIVELVVDIDGGQRSGFLLGGGTRIRSRCGSYGCLPDRGLLGFRWVFVGRRGWRALLLLDRSGFLGLWFRFRFGLWFRLGFRHRTLGGCLPSTLCPIGLDLGYIAV